MKNPGHMTKMATMPIYGKNPSPEPEDRFQQNLA